MAKLTGAQVEEITTWAEKGKSGLWIAGRMDIPAATVNYRMLVAGYDPWPGKPLNPNPLPNAFSKEEDARLLELSQTEKINQVARMMNRARTSVRIRLLTLEVRAEKALETA